MIEGTEAAVMLLLPNQRSRRPQLRRRAKKGSRRCAKACNFGEEFIARKRGRPGWASWPNVEAAVEQPATCWPRRAPLRPKQEPVRAAVPPVSRPAGLAGVALAMLASRRARLWCRRLAPPADAPRPPLPQPRRRQAGEGARARARGRATVQPQALPALGPRLGLSSLLTASTGRCPASLAPDPCRPSPIDQNPLNCCKHTRLPSR
jgi:hypothetical protein